MASNNKIIIKLASNREKYLVVKSGNNKTIANTETYKSMQGVLNAAEALKKIMKNAKIIDNTKK